MLNWFRHRRDALTTDFIAGAILMGVTQAIGTGSLLTWSIFQELPAPLIVAIGILAVGGIALIVNQGLKVTRRLRDRQLPWATPINLTQPFLSRLSLRLVDLAQEGQIRGRTFDNCDIYGPAVIVPGGVGIIQDCSFDGPNVLIEVTNSVVIGPIYTPECVFRRCRFHRVGIMGNKETIDNWRAGFTAQQAPDTLDVRS